MSAVSRRSRTAALLVAAALCGAVAFTAATATSATTATKKSSVKPAPVLKDPKVEGKKQAAKFLTLLKGEATPALKAFLSPQFLIQRADGTSATRASYLAGAVTNIKSFTITDVQATQRKDVLVVRYTAETDQIVDGQAYKKTPAPRLSTFVWNGKAWTLISHANFNTPQ